MGKNKIYKICTILIFVILSLLVIAGVIDTAYTSTMVLSALSIFTFLDYLEFKRNKEDSKISLYKKGACFFGLATVISFVLITGMNII